MVERATGISTSQLSRFENMKSRDLKYEQLQKIADYFGITVWTIFAMNAPVVGIAGAGPRGEISFRSGGENLGEAPPPPGGVTRDTVALVVRGDLMRGIANDGWFIYYDDRPEAPKEEHLEELCVVWLKSGEALVRTIYPGRAHGLYDLESPTLPLLRDQEVEKVALVTAMVPIPKKQRKTAAE